VEVRREGTVAWLALPQAAQMPFGPGDTLRVPDRGRGWLTFGDLGTASIITGDFTLEALAVAEGQATLHARLEGVAVFALPRPEAWTDFRLQVGSLTLFAPSSLFAVWSLPDSPPAIITAQGSARARRLNAVYNMRSGEGVLERFGIVSLAAVPPPLNEASLEAALFGCPAVVRTTGRVGLDVRRGPGQTFDALDLIFDDNAVSVLARTASGEWSRVQFLSGFGWMLSRALVADCPALPTLPDTVGRESLVRAWNVPAEEETLLRPFFGSPVINSVFFRYTE
jgi:hypothetical protein